MNKLMRKRKGQMQISFGWLFAIIVGVFILVLAIYASYKFIDLGKETTGAETGEEISVLLNPLETGFESGKTTLLEIPVETRIKNSCDSFGQFGSQKLELSQKSIGEFEIIESSPSFRNKYIFSSEEPQGKNFYLFSKPFEFPFKVANLIYLTSENEEYCFLNAPESVSEELESLNQPNIHTEIASCSEQSTKVCFDGTLPGPDSEINCDIEVDTFRKSVDKQGNNRVYYEENSLMYAAVFSSEEIYECQVQRLMQRLEALSLIYEDKSTILSQKGCPLEVNTLTLAGSADRLESSADLINVKPFAENAERDNKFARRCPLW